MSNIEKGGPGSGIKGHKNYLKPHPDFVRDLVAGNKNNPDSHLETRAKEYEEKATRSSHPTAKKDHQRAANAFREAVEVRNVKKGGPGSGVQGHKTAIQALNSKLVGGTGNPLAEHLHQLRNGAIWEGKKLTSGKPVVSQIEHARAHGFTPKDHRESGNLHYEHSKKMADRVEQLKSRKENVPKEMEDIVHHHNRAHKQHFAEAGRLEERANKVNEAANRHRERPVEKSLVGMGYMDSPEVDTAKFAVESAEAEQHPLSEEIRRVMEGYDFGGIPRSVKIDAGTLHLVKVDDGLYSGYLVKEAAGMSDTAHVRLERMTIPTLVNFLVAKEYERPKEVLAQKEPEIVADPEDILVINDILSAPLHTSVPVEPLEVKADLDRRIQILQLIDRLVN